VHVEIGNLTRSPPPTIFSSRVYSFAFHRCDLWHFGLPGLGASSDLLEPGGDRLRRRDLESPHCLVTGVRSSDSQSAARLEGSLENLPIFPGNRLGCAERNPDSHRFLWNEPAIQLMGPL
jgi:hypothetical protein